VGRSRSTTQAFRLPGHRKILCARSDFIVAWIAREANVTGVFGPIAAAMVGYLYDARCV
jgi:hypothetical protein